VVRAADEKECTMLRNYLKTAFRNLLRFKIYSAINIIGLAVGMAACMLIFLYVQNDMSFDKFNKNYNRIYRVLVEPKENENGYNWPLTPSGYAVAFASDFPEIKAVRLTPAILYTPVIKYENRMFTAKNFIFADSAFFDVFSFPFLKAIRRLL